MSRSRTLAILLACASLLGASTVSAQEPPTSPEGVDWQLTSHTDPEGGDPLPVPLGVAATLRLEGGQISGNGGCNAFTGTYSLDGTSLSFSELASTLVACDDPEAAVEEAYAAAMAEVAAWAIVDEALQLTDADGATLLSFEVPDISLTSSDLAGLVTALETLRTDIAALQDSVAELDATAEGLSDELDGINVERLRERIRALETSSTRLADRLDDLESEPAPERPARINAAERVLLEGIPARIANHCEPLRSGLPDGARAAVDCAPVTELVAGVAYYLMEGADAAAAFEDTMTRNDVPERTLSRTCERNRVSQAVLIGGGWQAEGCYRSGGRAHMRFVDNATDCRQLPVGSGRRLRNPALLVAITGTGSDIGRLRSWAVGEGGHPGLMTRISQHIERPGQPRSTGCPP